MVDNDLDIELPALTEIEFGESHTFQPIFSINENQITSFDWIPNDGFDCTNCPNPTTTPSFSNTYALTVTNSIGCTATANTQINLLNGPASSVYLPNVFSPNNDGINDILSVYGSPSIATVNALEVYDRWGNQLFAQRDFLPNNPSIGWDGRIHNGEFALPATYLIKVTVTFFDGQQLDFFKDVFLIR